MDNSVFIEGPLPKLAESSEKQKQLEEKVIPIKRQKKDETNMKKEERNMNKDEPNMRKDERILNKDELNLRKNERILNTDETNMKKKY